MPFFLQGTEARDGLGVRGEVGTKALLSGGCKWVSFLLWGSAMAKRFFFLIMRAYIQY